MQFSPFSQSVYKISRSLLEVLIILRPSIWSRDAISRWIRRRVSIKLCAPETLAMIGQASREESTSRTRKVQTHRDRKMARQVKSKVESMLITVFDIKGIVYK
jgi:hypothetical protein